MGSLGLAAGSGAAYSELEPEFLKEAGWILPEPVNGLDSREPQRRSTAAKANEQQSAFVRELILLVPSVVARKRVLLEADDPNVRPLEALGAMQCRDFDPS